MATKYILGQKAARFLHDAMNESPVGRRTSSAKTTDELEFAPAWTLRYSSSVSNGGSTGGWIIWLPEGSLEGCVVDTNSSSSGYMRPLTPANDRMPSGWYLLPSSVASSLSSAGTHHVYADSALGKIVFDTSSGRIHIADVIVDTEKGSKNVKQVARSVSTCQTPKPFDIALSGQQLTLERQYYTVGSKTYEANVSVPSSLSSSLPCIVALKVAMTGENPSAQIVTASNLSALQSMQENDAYATIPLYSLGSSGKVVCDFRSAPIIVAGEF